jgi:hypothetical protein
VAFGTGGRLPVGEGEPAAATFTLEVNEWNGVSEPRLVLRRAQSAVAAVAQEDAVAQSPAPEAQELVLFALP